MATHRSMSARKISSFSQATSNAARSEEETLSEYAQTNEVDLVVMTSRGRRRLNQWLIGRVADKLIRRIQVPVLLLHPRELPQPTEFRHILIALDGEIEDPALAPAVALGSLDPAAHYTLVRVVEPSLPIVMPLAPYPSSLEPERTARLVVEGPQLPGENP